MDFVGLTLLSVYCSTPESATRAGLCDVALLWAYYVHNQQHAYMTYAVLCCITCNQVYTKPAADTRLSDVWGGSIIMAQYMIKNTTTKNTGNVVILLVFLSQYPGIPPGIPPTMM